MWRDAAVPGDVPGSWDVDDPAVDSGEFDLQLTSDSIVDGLDMDDLFIVYRESSTWAMWQTGTDEIFKPKQISGGSGILWKDCVCPTPVGHIAATNDDLIVHQGTPNSFKSLIERRDRKFVQRELNIEFYKNSFIVPNLPEKEVWFCFPQQGYTYASLGRVF